MVITCPVCHQSGSKPIPQQHPEAIIYRCPQCRHCFSDIESIRKLEEYAPEYFEELHKNWFQNPNISLFKRLGGLIKQHKENASVIDVGCGKGDFLKYLRQKHPALSLTGIDLSSNKPIPGVRLLQGDILEQNPDRQGRQNRQYDVVVSMVTIEHVTNIHLFVQRLHDLCLPGGLVIIMTNNEQGLLYGTSRCLHRWSYKSPFIRLYSKHHLNHFNPSSLQHLVKGHGLLVMDLLHHHSPLAAIDMPQASYLVETALRLAVSGLFLLGQWTKRDFLQTVICKKMI